MHERTVSGYIHSFPFFPALLFQGSRTTQNFQNLSLAEGFGVTQAPLISTLSVIDSMLGEILMIIFAA